MKLYDLIWLVPLFPLAGAVFNGLVSNRRGLSKAVTHSAALLGAGLAWLYGWAAMIQWFLTEDRTAPYVVRAFEWISGGAVTIAGGRTAEVAIAASFQVDPLSAVMVGFVTFVGFLIHLYSVGYMHGESDRAYARYFSFLNLFMFAMLTLVLGSNLPVLFVGWEGVGLCSYLLIGFYFEKDWCAAAGMKAFIVNRIGDFGFLLAIFFAFFYFGTLEFDGLFRAMANDHHGDLAGAATIIGLLLFVGAIGKSAQLPLYVWLPDAMAGPTPVSALIHAATMVTAGVYMVARCNYFYQMSPAAMLTVAVIGGVTAVFSATIGLVQNDIKKVLAYSTVSQLGYMFLAAGVGAYIAAIFHVVTHAFFKACLFLGSGSVIHACGGEQDMRKMGGLRKHMPTTYWTFLAATIAIAGIPPLAGFVSKDAILAKVFEAGYTNLNDHSGIYYLLWVLGLGGAALTAFYMFRLVYMTFFGEFRGGVESEHHLHESPWTMTLPLQVLAVLSIVGGLLIGFPGQLFHLEGWSFIDRFLGPVVLQAHGDGHHGHAVGLGLEWILVGLSVAVAVGGILMARRFYRLDPAWTWPQHLAARFPLAYRMLLNKYWVDELYDATVVRGTVRLADLLWELDARVVDGAVNGTRHATVGSSWLSGIFDLQVVDGLVNLLGNGVRVTGRESRRLQVGFAQGYVMVMVFGAALLLGIFFVATL
ncbi:MAG: NADH-quinone oxidoreductase subunit L [Thermoanaerobaculales bacterium]|jgi:NADH-quinone oxidoreductase subunit L|nr:NADH-quinone oxidoreductase subunit L [Thermoanaerobaculales bacterium]